MKKVFLIFIGVLFLFSCCTPGRERQKYPGVDPKVNSYYKEFMDLSAGKHIIFNKKVKIVFSNIKEADAVGLCKYSVPYREIVFDKNYWEKSTKITRLALVFHEMIHCFCGRKHDHNGLPYEEPKTSNIACKLSEDSSGRYFEDECPTSIMHPVVLSDSCMLSHYNYYVEEMFDHCNPI